METNLIPTLGNSYHLIVEDKRQRAISADKKPTIEAASFKTIMPGRREGNPNHHRDNPGPKDTKPVMPVNTTPFMERTGTLEKVASKR